MFQRLLDYKNFFLETKTDQSNSLLAVEIDSIPDEITIAVFAQLSAKDLSNCRGVCRRWKSIAEDDSLWTKILLDVKAFTKKHWKDFFNVDVDELPLPKGIYHKLIQQCPYLKGTLMDNYVLIYVPDKVDGEFLTVEKMGRLFKDHFPNVGCEHSGYLKDPLYINGLRVDEPKWILMAKKIIPNFVGFIGHRGFEQEKKLSNQIDNLLDKSKKFTKYRTPLAMEVIICMFTEYARSGVFLCADHYILCEAGSSLKPEVSHCIVPPQHIIVGGFNNRGIDVYDTMTQTFNIVFVHELRGCLDPLTATKLDLDAVRG